MEFLETLQGEGEKKREKKKKKRKKKRETLPLTCTRDLSNQSTIGASVVDGAVKPSIESF